MVLGGMNGLDTHIEQSDSWLRDGVNSLVLGTPIEFLPASAIPSGRLKMRVELAKVSTMTVNTAQVTTLALKVTYSQNGKDSETKVYRGDTANGWLGLGSQLNAALTRALDQLRPDLLERCGLQAKLKG
jgi:hypothetical protein